MVLNDMFEFKLNSIDQHPPSLVNDMRRFMLNEELSDVTFVVEGREIHACKALLASRSDYFMYNKFCIIIYGNVFCRAERICC